MRSKNTSTSYKKVGYAWLTKMAWRDARKNRSRLLLFVSSIVLGIAALVAVYSFRDNMERDIDDQAKTLTGADLMVESRQPFSAKAVQLLSKLGNETSTERSFASMIYFLRNEQSRLVQVKAIEGNFPYYGKLETTPLRAAGQFKDLERGALVDRTVMLQYNAKAGDSIKIGSLSFLICGSLDKAPGQSSLSSTVAPVVYIPLKYLEQTGLSKIGSRIQYKYYFKYNSGSQLNQDLKKLQPMFDKEGLDIETVASRKERIGRSFQDVSRFLALSGFIALLLGCIGVGSSIQVYIKEKLTTIATLRCLGLRVKEAFLIYLIQITGLGIIGSVLGAVIGTLIQFALPVVFKDFIPVELSMQPSWSAIGQGILLGVFISILFAMPALLAVRNISPLNAIRQSLERSKQKTDYLLYATYCLIFIFVLAFSRLQMNNWFEAGIFCLSLLFACSILYGISRLLMFLVRKMVSRFSSYLYRQGFSNLYRPNNQTLMLTVSIGLSTTLICTLFLIQGILIQRVQLSSSKSQANMILFDIQSSQQDAAAALAKSYGLPVIAQVPVVTVRIDKINGRSAMGKRRDDKAFQGELRVTFQDTLTAAEKIVSGTWRGRKGNDGKIFVSLEDGYARRINAKIGDTILFNVQRLPISTIVGSLRTVNWTRMQTNFRVVFPTGVLEDAPQFHVLMTKVPSNIVSAKFQGAVVRNFPNISVIDLGLVLKVVEDLLSKISFVIKFMASFSMATGWVVLISAVLTSKSQRLKEIILLRTLGASKKQIMIITIVEYAFLGVFAAGAGVLLSLSASWALSAFLFDATFNFPIIPVVVIFLSVCLIIVITGVLSSRKTLNTPPIQILNA
ncbi:putative ABC transport system permease protein [Pedobacter sp. UYP24]